jgi:hypothetical protein
VSRENVDRFLGTLLRLTVRRHADLVKPPDAHQPHRTVKPSHRASVKASTIRLLDPGMTTTYGRGEGGAKRLLLKERGKGASLHITGRWNVIAKRRGRPDPSTCVFLSVKLLYTMSAGSSQIGLPTPGVPHVGLSIRSCIESHPGEVVTNYA